MKVTFLAKFSKDLDKLKDKNARKSIKKAILDVEQAESLNKITGLKRLKGEKGAYRLRVGNYRIGLYIQNDHIEMARVAHRKDIYDLFP
ncbi:type II toxin-antitoxin system RelE/ParE family toxin [Pleurocapsales cyanobacterium LEGE 10410]|nr:type II toxin-antitoxin system RelE/ParE family toxin [Pleurocapsales cyanobacterium LEGE 10410]